MATFPPFQIADDAVRADAPGALAQAQGLTGGRGCEVTIDCSGSPQGRLLGGFG